MIVVALMAALGLSLVVNGALLLLLYGAYRQNAAMTAEVTKAKTLVDFALTELRKRSAPLVDRDRAGMRNLLADLLKDWPVEKQVH